MMYGSDLGVIEVCHIHEVRKKSGWNFYNMSLLIVRSVQINSSIAFYLLDKSNMVNDVSE
jgi:hypothetical protein